MNLLYIISTFKLKALQICIEYLHMTQKRSVSLQSKCIINFFTNYLNKIFQLIFSCCVCLHLTPQMWCCRFHSWRPAKMASGIMWICQATKNMAFKAREFLYTWQNSALSSCFFPSSFRWVSAISWPTNYFFNEQVGKAPRVTSMANTLTYGTLTSASQLPHGMLCD